MTIEQEWQRAQQRVILYLRLLNMPALEALQVATEALQRAQKEVHGGGGELPPVTLAMQCLRQVLGDIKGKAEVGPEREALFRSVCPWSPPPEKGDMPAEARSMPPIHRGSMVPEVY
jgi:hypothetical protein